MKKTFKALLLAVLVVCTICALTVMAGATEAAGTYVDGGYVMMYQSDKTTAIEDADRTETELRWEVRDVTEGETTERVLTITGSDTTLTFNSSAAWNAMSSATIPWYDYVGTQTKSEGAITKVVIEAPITKITQACAFNQLFWVKTFVLPDTNITIASNLSMPFANMRALTTFGPEGTPENTIDLRNFSHTGSQAFENTCYNKTITVLMPYVGSSPLGTAKLFSAGTKATFKVLANSPCEKFVKETYPAATKDIYMPASNIQETQYYTGLVITGQESDANNRNFKWTLDVDSGALAIERHEEPLNTWMQVDFGDANWTAFASGWKNYVKDVTVAHFGKLSIDYGTSQCFLAGSTSLETVRFAGGQRMQNGYAATKGWFQGCTALKSVVFGSAEFVDGVADLSGVNIVAGQDSTDTWLTNMFNGCSAIEKIILPTGSPVTNLPASMITDCTSLKEIVIGSNITTIEEGTFDAWINSTEGYSDLTVRFTEENSTVGLALKESAAGRLTVVVPETTIPTSGDVSGDDTDENDLKWAFDAATGKLTISGTSTEIAWAGGAIANWEDTSMIPWYADYLNLITTVEITAPVTAIPAYMFYKNGNLETVILPDTCAALGACAFNDCRKLTSVQVAGKNTPANVIDLRCMTGTNGIQVFESAFNGEVTIWMPKTAEKLDLNDKFGVAATKAHFVVYPGSAGEITVYDMINKTGDSVHGEITYSYYTDAEDADLAAAWQALTSGVATVNVGYGIANWTIDVETGIVTVTVSKSAGGSTADCTLKANETAWVTFVNTFKYAIKEVHLLTGSAKLNAESTLTGLPELTTIIFNGTRMQGSTKFNNNPKLTTFGTAENVVDGVLNLSKLNDNNNGGLTGKDSDANAAALTSSMFSGCTSVTEVILPANSHASYTIFKIAANAFNGCTALETIVIPENCTITSFDSTAFTGLTKAVKIVDETADGALAALLMADGVLPVGSYIYKIYNSDETLTGGIVFDGWKVRLEKYNGLRGVFYFDNDVTATNNENGWTLVEYGALLATTANKDAHGVKVDYDFTTGKTSVNDTTRSWSIYTTNGDATGKILTGSDVNAETNGTYFAVSVTKYSANYRTDVYMAGYEVWKNTEGKVVIMYTDYATDEKHNADFADTNIYDVSMSMYKAGVMNANVDKNNIVWDSLVAGGAITLTKGTDYVTSDTYCVDAEGNPLEVINMVTGEAFGDTFTLANVPMVNQYTENVTNDQGTEDTADDVAVKTLKFNNSGVTYTVLADPDNEGKYVLVYRDDPEVNGTKIPGTSPWSAGYYGQLETGWYPGNTGMGIEAVQQTRPNPKFKNSFYTSCNYVIIDYGVTETASEAFKGSGGITYVYNSTFKTLGNGAFQGTANITTMFPAGTTPVEGRAELSPLTSVGDSYVFNGTTKVVEINLPVNTSISTQFAQGQGNTPVSGVTSLWMSTPEYNEDGSLKLDANGYLVNCTANRIEGAINLVNATKATSIGSKAFTGTKATQVILPATVTSIDATAFTAATLEIVQYADEAVEAIQTYCTDKGYTYTLIAPLAGWSNVVVD